MNNPKAFKPMSADEVLEFKVKVILDPVPGAWSDPEHFTRWACDNRYVQSVELVEEKPTAADPYSYPAWKPDSGATYPPEGGSAPVVTEEQREALEFVIATADATCGFNELVAKHLAVLRDMMVVPYGAKPLAGESPVDFVRRIDSESMSAHDETFIGLASAQVMNVAQKILETLLISLHHIVLQERG